MADKTKAQLAEELAAAEKKNAAAEKRIAAAEAKAAVAKEEAAEAKERAEKQTATATAEPKKRRRRTLQERLGQARAGGQLAKGEHMMDLVRVRNNTNLDQVVTTDDDRRVKLIAKGITDKSAVMADKSGNPDTAELEVFPGGTVVLSRKLAIPLVAHGVVEIIKTVDEADPDDYEEDE
jgi:membrane protein involved in colicin uptake